jgi:bifunctional non-homologous end joining protein LigD
MIVRKRDDRLRLFTRRGFDWTHKFPMIVEALAALKARSVTIDGEAVWCEPKTGLSVFDKLHSQARTSSSTRSIYWSSTARISGASRSWSASKGSLRSSRALGTGCGLTSTSVGIGSTIFAHACRLGAEGIVSKRRDAPCRSGRARTWKVKNPKGPAVIEGRDLVCDGG